MVLDLLGMDPNPPEGGGAANGGAGAGGSDGVDESGGGEARLVLTAMAPLPSMMGPVGAARGAASEMAALCGEVSLFLCLFVFCRERGRITGGRGSRWPCSHGAAANFFFSETVGVTEYDHRVSFSVAF